MPPQRRLRKIVDEEALVSCKSGTGLLREEVWVDTAGRVARYNLAFINHFLMSSDNGRVLGYDNAHGQLHRHWFGAVEAMKSQDYETIATCFFAEVAELRKR